MNKRIINKEVTMYKYTVEAYDQTDMGKLNTIMIVVQAKDEEEALLRASTIKNRTNYSLVGIEELSREFKKG